MDEPEPQAPSYHDLHITTAGILRTSIADLPFGFEVHCTRVGGWQVWRIADGDANAARLVAGEYDGGLRLDVAGHVIADSLGDTAIKADPELTSGWDGRVNCVTP